MTRLGLKKPPARYSLRPKPHPSAPPSAPPRLSVVSAAPPVTESLEQAPRAAAPAPVAAAPSPATGNAPESVHAHEPATAPGSDTDHDDHAYLHVEGLSRSFFSRAPAHTSFDVWDDSTALPMPHSSRRAMHATLLILGVSALLVGGFLIHQKLIMPVPAELGAGATMPSVFPIPVEPTARAAPPSPAVLAAPRAAVAPDVVAPSRVAAAAQAAPVEVAPVHDAQLSAVAPSASAEAPRGGTESAYAPLLAAAEALRGRGRRAEVRAAYEQILTVYPDAPDVLRKLAYLHLDSGDNARAQELAIRATTLVPTNAEGWIVLGAAREGLGDRPGAREAYRKCATLDDGEFSAECRRLIR